LGYFLVSLIATWPLVIHLRGWVPGWGDWGQNLWALWWTRQALLNLGQSPFFTDYLFHPEGVTLLFHPLDVSDGLLTIPLYGLFGGDVAYNLIILLSFLLGGWGTYLLALYLTGRRVASFVAGLVFILSPYHLLRIDLGHLNLSTLQWIPFFTLFLFEYVRRGTKHAAVLAVLFLVLNALNSWYYVAYCSMFALVVIFYPFDRPLFSPTVNQSGGSRAVSRAGRPQRRSLLGLRLARVGLILVVSLIILSPLLVPMVRLLGSTALVGAHNPLRHSVDLFSLWVPGPPSTWAGWFEDVWISYAAQNREPGASAYLGYSVLALTILGIFGRRWRPQVLWWLAVAVGATLLALGPRLQIDGQLLGISLPYGWLATLLPLVSITGIPGRLVVITSLALAILATFGLATLTDGLLTRRPMRLWNDRRQKTFAVGLAAVVGVLLFLEYLAVPLRLSRTELDDFYRAIASDAEDFSILDIKWDANFLLHAQTVHGKPLVGGWLARLPEAQATYLNQGGLDKSFLFLLLGPEGSSLSERTAVRSAVRNALAERKVRYIIDHNRTAQPWLEQYLGWSVIYEGDDIVVFENEDEVPD
jgi:hypothetical protein